MNHEQSGPLSQLFVLAMTAILAFSLWLTISPYVIPAAVPTLQHILFGLVLSGLAVLFLYAGVSQPVDELGSTWHILVLAILVLTGAFARLPRDALLFWSDVLTAGAILVLSLYALYLSSRFAKPESEPTSDKRINGN